MIFGKIDYLNLLPFHVFMKKFQASSSFKASMSRHSGYPAYINNLFEKKIVDAAFISSIKAKNKKCLSVGIVARKEVWSVILKPGSKKDDSESATSNILAKVLGLDGEVFIGDKALWRYLKQRDAYIDLASEWHKKHRLPFVFARLCCNKNSEFFKEMADSFVKSKIYIPSYILKRYAQKTGIREACIKEYLKKIEYKIDKKGGLSLKKFYNAARAEYGRH